MSSLVQGYKYDVFISYRQKDNKGDGWVSGFVGALKNELESTFKEDISVYFDINPHDGLLETHDVDASLHEKLKCLIFIPVISRTYCDPKSFAWEHEFKAFVKLASEDQFGLKIKLSNGNVTSRVLPVIIHELDKTDLQECYKVLGVVLRGIEFIYKEPGVNKPLTPDDDEKKNLYKTKYRIQINKVANAVKEIITGLKVDSPEPEEKVIRSNYTPEESGIKEMEGFHEKSVKQSKSSKITAAATLALLITIAAFVYPKIFRQGTLEKLRSSGEKISVAVLPFQNMTNDTTWNIWQLGIQYEIINFLTNTEDLKIRQNESVSTVMQSQNLKNFSSITPSIARNLSEKLDVNVFIWGSIIKSGTSLHINTQLIDSKTLEIFRSFQIVGPAENIILLVDSLSTRVRDFLIVSKLEKELPVIFRNYESTKSPEAFRYFIQGNESFYMRDYKTAITWYEKALTADSGYVVATCYLSVAYGFSGQYELGKKYCLKAYKKRDILQMRTRLMVEWVYAFYFETPFEQIKYMKQYLEIDDQNPLQYYLLGSSYMTLEQFDNAIAAFERSLEISARWEVKPMWVFSYTDLGFSYHKKGLYRKEREIYKKAETDFPNYSRILNRQIILALSEGKDKEADEYIAKYITVHREASMPEEAIFENLASIYDDAGKADKAEEYYRKALAIEPEYPLALNNFAWHLIENDKNPSEAMELIDKALIQSPKEYLYLDTKGWGLYKQGRYKEALEYLEKSWKNKGVYNHDVYLHLEAAKKALTGQK